ncbi:MAG: hypothetical protein Q7S40_17310 [Opitutaceae bacterium]|nr:hypothetical protein [Opitutaceae bacterium]
MNSCPRKSKIQTLAAGIRAQKVSVVVRRGNWFHGWISFDAVTFGQRPARIHELTVDDEGRVFLGENDNHDRSSYLWSVRFD